MTPCKKATRLISDALDRPLSKGEQFQLAMHLPLCSGCRNYRKQLQVLRAAALALRSGEAPSDGDDPV